MSTDCPRCRELSNERNHLILEQHENWDRIAELENTLKEVTEMIRIVLDPALRGTPDG